MSPPSLAAPMAGSSQGSSSAPQADLSTIYTAGKALPSQSEVAFTALVMVAGAGEAGQDELTSWCSDVQRTWPVTPSAATSSSSNALPHIGKTPRSWTTTHQTILAYAKESIRTGTCKDQGASFPIKAVLEAGESPVFTTTDQVSYSDFNVPAQLKYPLSLSVDPIRCTYPLVVSVDVIRCYPLC